MSGGQKRGGLHDRSETTDCTERRLDVTIAVFFFVCFACRWRVGNDRLGKQAVPVERSYSTLHVCSQAAFYKDY